MIEIIGVFFLVLTSSTCFSQSDSLNQENELGRQGYWIIYSRMVPEKGFASCDSCKIEEGNYIDNRKNGIWIKYHKDGITPRLEGNYVDNRPNGKYKKFDLDGAIIEQGVFSSGKRLEVFRGGFYPNLERNDSVFYDSGKLLRLKVPLDEDSTYEQITYYHPTGKPEFIYITKNGVNVGLAIRYFENGDKKEEIEYNEDGSVLSRVEFEREHPPFESKMHNYSYQSELGHYVEGHSFKKNGYNIVFNADQELVLIGKFKDGNLWDGQYYFYDSDGVLLKIAIIKKGKYNSDGRL